MASHSSSLASVGAGSFNFYESDDFVATRGHLSQVDVNSLSVYMDGSLKYLGTANCRTGAAIFFKNIDLVLGVGVQGLMLSTLVELQAIVLALECVSAVHSVNLFLDSQAALDACKSELSLVCPDFCNQCWVKHRHIWNVIHSKNLRVNWHKVKGHSGILGNDHTDSIADAVFLSEWYLLLCMGGHFLLVDGGIVFGNSRHFVQDVCRVVCHVHWKVSSSSGFLASSLCSDVDWLSFSRIWHPDLHMATGFTSRLTADTCTYLIKTLHYRLPVAVQKCIYDKCYPSVLYLYCGKVEVSDHVFSCVIDNSEAVTVFHDLKVAGVKITDFMHSLCSAFRNDIWLVCTKHCAFMEKNGLIPVNGSIPILVFGSVLRLSPGVIKLLGVTEAFGVLFGFHKSCSFFSDIGDMVSVNIVV
ncbi:hypothetical protein G9A89_021540 [Geosiphon pyriformis]|nr:hypothetical protein G9A89_021540 [Geosiphon pyriformis]